VDSFRTVPSSFCAAVFNFCVSGWKRQPPSERAAGGGDFALMMHRVPGQVWRGLSPSKAEKSIFLCDYLSSRETQHEVHEGLNVVENWNAINDFICYGRQGELATNSREQQEIVPANRRHSSSMVPGSAVSISRLKPGM
jgi:Tn3 transposase DDE domain